MWRRKKLPYQATVPRNTREPWKGATQMPDEALATPVLSRPIGVCINGCHGQRMSGEARLRHLFCRHNAAPGTRAGSRKVLWPMKTALCSFRALRGCQAKPVTFVGITPLIARGRISRLPDILPLSVSYYPKPKAESGVAVVKSLSGNGALGTRSRAESLVATRQRIATRRWLCALCSAVAHRRMRTTDVRRSSSPFVGISRHSWRQVPFSGLAVRDRAGKNIQTTVHFSPFSL